MSHIHKNGKPCKDCNQVNSLVSKIINCLPGNVDTYNLICALNAVRAWVMNEAANSKDLNNAIETMAADNEYVLEALKTWGWKEKSPNINEKLTIQ